MVSYGTGIQWLSLYYDYLPTYLPTSPGEEDFLKNLKRKEICV
jgi:hypothetical protein